MRNLTACASWTVRHSREVHRVLAILCRAGAVCSVQKEREIYSKCVKKEVS